MDLRRRIAAAAALIAGLLSGKAGELPGQSPASSTAAVVAPATVQQPVPSSQSGPPAPVVQSNPAAPLSTVASQPSAVAPIGSAPLQLKASLSSRTLLVVKGDSTLGSYAVAIGADEHPTPEGTFLIKRIVWNPRWVPPDAPWARGKSAKDPGHPDNPMKRVKIFFQEPDYYIHGTGALESLGKAESHGCLRMDPEQAAEVARLIMEHGGQPREENWFWRILHFRREEKTVYLDNPISFTIGS